MIDIPLTMLLVFIFILVFYGFWHIITESLDDDIDELLRLIIKKQKNNMTIDEFVKLYRVTAKLRRSVLLKYRRPSLYKKLKELPNDV